MVWLLYAGLFLHHVIFSLLHLQMISPCLEFALTKVWLKRDNLKHWLILISSSLRKCGSDYCCLGFKLPADNKGERSENKTGVNISLYIQYITFIACNTIVFVELQNLFVLYRYPPLQLSEGFAGYLTTGPVEILKIEPICLKFSI